MRVRIIAVGTRGDVQPYLAIGQGLRRSGHEVRIVSREPFRRLAVGAGLDFAAIPGGDDRPSGARPVGVQDGRAGLVAQARQKLRYARAYAELDPEQVVRACEGGDLVIFSPLGFAGYPVAEKLGVPSCAAMVQPLIPSRAYPPLILPPGARLGGGLNRLAHAATEHLFWQAVRGPVNRRLRHSLALPPYPLGGPIRRMRRERLPILLGVSPTVVPRPDDWGDWIDVCGYWFLDRPADWAPPAELVDFIAAGEPPVAIGFSSLRAPDAPELTRLVVEAVRRAGRRAIVVTGWGGLAAPTPDDDLLAIEEAPHDWLFPRVAAVVHHGAAGTSAAALRAGVPSVVIPFYNDQPFWGDRLARLGVAPAPIPRKRLTVEALAAAIEAAVREERYRAHAAEVGRRIAAEDGVGRAVAFLERRFGGARA